MASFADIGTLIFGTYDTNLGQHWLGDKLAHTVIKDGSTKNIKLNKKNIFGIGSNLGLKENQIHSIFNDFKKPEEAFNEIKRMKNISNDADLINAFKGNLGVKYGTKGFEHTSFIDRFKINFNKVKNDDLVYRIFKGEKSVLKEFFKEVGEAGSKQKNLAKYGAKALKIAGKSLPLIGVLSVLVFDVPNVIKSFNNYGAGEGIKETGRTAFNLAGFAAGTALGATIGSGLPIIGTIIGGIVGGIAGGFAGKLIFGKAKVDTQSEIESLGVSKEQAKTMVKQGYDTEDIREKMLAQQQMVQPQQFGTYSNPTAYRTPMLANNGISLGDENMLSNGMSAYRYYQGMVA